MEEYRYKTRGLPRSPNKPIKPGDMFWNWTTIKIIPADEFDKNSRWLCRCSCGVERVIQCGSLRNGNSKSCGCRGNKAWNPKHGLAGTNIYMIWAWMLQRCNNPKATAFKHYGGRGIKVCERWHNFENFYADMGPRPGNKSIDRINNDGNYEPGNCRWATSHEQALNKRPRRKK